MTVDANSSRQMYQRMDLPREGATTWVAVLIWHRKAEASARFLDRSFAGRRLARIARIRSTALAEKHASGIRSTRPLFQESDSRAGTCSRAGAGRSRRGCGLHGEGRIRERDKAGVRARQCAH